MYFPLNVRLSAFKVPMLNFSWLLLSFKPLSEVRVLSNWPAHMTIWRALIIDLLFSLISVSPCFKLKKNLSIYSSIIPKKNRLLYLAERGHNIAIQRSHSQKIPIQWQFHQKGLDLFLEVITKRCSKQMKTDWRWKSGCFQPPPAAPTRLTVVVLAGHVGLCFDPFSPNWPGQAQDGTDVRLSLPPTQGRPHPQQAYQRLHREVLVSPIDQHTIDRRVLYSTRIQMEHKKNKHLA